MSSFAPMARATSIPRVAGGVVMKPIFVHPSHFEGASSPTSSYLGSTSSLYPSSSSSSSSTTSDEDHLARVNDLSLDSSPPSPSSSLASHDSRTDYFSAAFSRAHRNSDAESYFTMNTSPASSNSSTPTCESPMTLSQPLPSLARTFSFGANAEPAPATDATDATAFPASFPFATFGAPISRPSSPGRASPYARPASSAAAAGGSMMTRSVSSPVETQRELDLRRRRQADASEVMHESATKMARCRSMAASHMLRTSSSMTRGSSTSAGIAPVAAPPVARAACPSPLVTPFGEGWGAALPPRELDTPGTLPFPYNYVTPAPSHPCRLNRSYSATYVEGLDHAPASSVLYQHRNSVPSTSLSATSFSSQTSAPTPTSTSRPRRGTLGLAPLTPIIPSSPLVGEDVESFASALGLLPLMMPGKLHRGVSYS